MTIERISLALPTMPNRLILDRKIAYRGKGGGELWLMGGFDSVTFLASSELWRWRLRDPEAGWVQIHPIGPEPVARSGQGWAYDIVRDRFVMHGGLDDASVFRGDTWSFDPTTFRWTDLAAPTSPGAYQSQFAYDPSRDVFVRFGGLSALGDPGRLDTTAEFNPVTSTWAVIAVIVRPPKTQWGGMAYDLTRGKMILFGGNTTGAIEINETWIYEPTATPSPTWREQMIPAAQRPPPRRGFTFAYHPALRGIVAAFGSSASVQGFSDSWLLTLEGWRQMHPESIPTAADYAYGAMAAGLRAITTFLGQSQVSPFPVLQEAHILGRDEEWVEAPIGIAHDQDEIEILGGLRLRDPATVADSLASMRWSIPVRSIAAIDYVLSIPIGTDIRTALEFPETGPIYWDGLRWSASDLSAAEMASTSDTAAQLGRLSTDFPALAFGTAGFATLLKMHWRPLGSGSLTPELDQIELDREPGPAVMPATPRLVRIHGPALDLDGSPASGAVLRVTGPATGAFHGLGYLTERGAEAEVDSDGNVELSVFETESIGVSVVVQLDLGAGQGRSATVEIPDQDSVDLETLLG